MYEAFQPGARCSQPETQLCALYCIDETYLASFATVPWSVFVGRGIPSLGAPTWRRNHNMKQSVAPVASPAKQIAGFIAKFEPADAKLIRECRTAMRRLLPTAVELVYDNCNFFVIGYSATERPSDCIVSIAAAANGVGLSFYHGASLPDPQHLLLGSGTQNRFVRLPSAQTLRSPGVLALIDAAVAQADPALPDSCGGHTIVRSVSVKQRPRRKARHAD